RHLLVEVGKLLRKPRFDDLVKTGHASATRELRVLGRELGLLGLDRFLRLACRDLGVRKIDHLLPRYKTLALSLLSRLQPLALERYARIVQIFLPLTFEFTRLLTRGIKFLHGKAAVRGDLALQRQPVSAPRFAVV